MENCVVFELKGAVQNNNLDFMGALVIDFKTISGATAADIGQTIIVYGPRVEITVIEGHLYTDASCTKEFLGDINNKDIDTLSTLYRKKNEKSSIKITDKYYGIKNIKFNRNLYFPINGTVKIDSLKYCYNLHEIYFNIINFDRDCTLEEIIENVSEKWGTDEHYYYMPTMGYGNIKFGGKYPNAITYKSDIYAIKDTNSNIVTLYNTRSGNPGSYVYSDELGTYNISTRTWNYGQQFD